jgi:hypothetical protein
MIMPWISKGDGGNPAASPRQDHRKVTWRQIMVFRRRWTFIPLAAGLLIAMGTFAGISVVTAGPASAQAEITICLTYSSSYCADVMDSDNRSGQQIWLYQASAGAHDYHWYEIPVSCGNTSCLCLGESCVEFEDAQDTSLCLGVSSDLNEIQLIGCELGYGGTARAAWIEDDHYLVNFFLGAANGYLAVNSPLANGKYLYPEPYSAPGGSVWERWSGP